MMCLIINVNIEGDNYVKVFIDNVNEKIFTYLDNYSDLINEDKDKITIEHLLTMTSGLEWNEWDVTPEQQNNDIMQLNSSPDPVRYVLAKPIVSEPGTSFYYSGGGVNVLGGLIRIASGLRVDNFSGQYLFGPLGITDFQWQTLYPSGFVACHGDCYLRPRDMAKFGYLFLNNGVWNGNRIISEAWVRRSAEEYISLPQVSWADGYGYLWWLYTYNSNNQSFESFRADGWGGQQIIIFPNLNMVVVFTGANYTGHPPCEEILTRYILPAIQ